MDISANNKKILEFLKDKENSVVLTDKQNSLLNRYFTAYNVWMQHKSKKVAANLLSKMPDYGSFHTALNDLKTCELLFGDLNETSKKLKRIIAEDTALEIYNIAKKNKNLDAMNKALNNYIKAAGLNHVDVDLPDFSKLQMPEQPLVIDIDFLNKYGDKLEDTQLQKIRKAFLDTKIFKYMPNLIKDIPILDITADDK